MKPRKVDRKSPKISAISAAFAVMKTNIDNSGVPARQHLSFPFIGSQVLRRPVTTIVQGTLCTPSMILDTTLPLTTESLV